MSRRPGPPGPGRTRPETALPGLPGLPDLRPLRQVAAALEAAGIPFALGGSGLLAALGLARTVHDWDLTTDAGLEPVSAGLGGQRTEIVGPGGVHEDSKLRFAGGTVELIVRMAIRTEAGACRIPTMTGGAWRGVPLGSPEAWAVAYALLGREEKAGLLFGYLESRGAGRGAVARLLAEPLPEAVAARVRALAG